MWWWTIKRANKQKREWNWNIVYRNKEKTKKKKKRNRKNANHSFDYSIEKTTIGSFVRVLYVYQVMGLECRAMPQCVFVFLDVCVFLLWKYYIQPLENGIVYTTVGQFVRSQKNRKNNEFPTKN